MKLTTIKQLLLTLFIAFSTYSVYAYDFEVDGIYYDVISTTELTCKVAKAKYTGDIIVPATVDYKNRSFQVIDISDSFKSTTIKSIILPNTVTIIEKEGFLDCNLLTKIELSDNITSIGNNAFKNCYKLSAVNLPDKLETIAYGAFSYCTELVSVQIPNSVISIGGAVFEKCTSLINVTIGNSVKTIGDNVFKNCDSLKSISLGNNVKTIGSSAFYECSSLISVTLPNSVTTLGYWSFIDCASLETIKLSESLTKIERGCFKGCESLTSLTIPGSVKYISLYHLTKSSSADHTFPNSLHELKIEYGETPLTSEFYNGQWDQSGLWDEDWHNKPMTWTNKIENVFFDRELNTDFRSLPSLKELTIGEHLKKVPINNIAKCGNLTTIISCAPNPPVLPTCSAKQFMDVIVKVPEQSLSLYQQADGWKNFWNLEGDPSLNSNTSGVENIILENPEKVETGRYDLNGRPVSDSYKGITIVRYSDGSTTKVMNK